jgi:hypothetical protein
MTLELSATASPSTKEARFAEGDIDTHNPFAA